jgi:hypothetical protein
LRGASSFLEVGEFLSIWFVSLVEFSLSAESFFDLVQSDLVLSSFFSRFLEFSGVDSTNEWNFNVFRSIWNSISLVGASTFFEVLIEILGIALIFLWKGGLSTLSTSNLVESDFLISFKDIVVKGKVNFSNNWNIEGFGSISMGETLIGTGTFLESSKVDNVFLVVSIDGSLSADFTLEFFVKGLLGGCESLAE